MAASTEGKDGRLSTPSDEFRTLLADFERSVRESMHQLATPANFHAVESMRAKVLAAASLRSEREDTVRVSRSLAERTEAMFRSVDPQGCIAQEWKEAIK